MGGLQPPSPFLLWSEMKHFSLQENHSQDEKFVEYVFESSQPNCRTGGFHYGGSEIMTHCYSSWCSQSQPSFGKDNWIRSMQVDLAKH